MTQNLRTNSSPQVPFEDRNRTNRPPFYFSDINGAHYLPAFSDIAPIKTQNRACTVGFSGEHASAFKNTAAFFRPRDVSVLAAIRHNELDTAAWPPQALSITMLLQQTQNEQAIFLSGITTCI